MYNILGIRHHGSGSARAVLRALEATQPDCILIECPADAEPLLAYCQDAMLTPPVAMLLYNPKNLQQAAYIPFATFSPEWQAIQWAKKNDVPIRFMDLPQAIMLPMAEHKKTMLLATEESELLRDPLGFLARLAGYEDSERWWEITFEQNNNNENIFPVIREMMRNLREELNRPETQETLLREAFMRKCMRQARKDNFQNITIVCGAWHAPALEAIHIYKESADNNALKGLKKINMEATWIPWSYYRLSTASGYGAGINTPIWYEMLFKERDAAHIRWLTMAAQLIRHEDINASTAHIMDAVQLANTLAALRERSIPGIDELMEAARTTICQGNELLLKLIEQKLIVGDVMGQVSQHVPTLPLQRDFEAAIKSARLSKEYQSASKCSKILDLRKDSNLAASQLLHRLQLLKIPFGNILEGKRFATGSFAEHWELHWLPDYILRIIEAAMWGSTLLEAATNASIHAAQQEQSISELAKLLNNALKADISAAIPSILTQLQQQTAQSNDVIQLAETLPILVQAYRYGNARQLDVASLEHIIDEIVPRLALGFAAACSNIDEDLARLRLVTLLDTHHALAILENEDYTQAWLEALGRVATLPLSHPLLMGVSVRLLLDKQIWSIEKVATLMQYALSQPDMNSAHWLEGFLQGSAMLLLHQPSLLSLLDAWVSALDNDAFRLVLPLLRRAFAQFPAPERHRIMQLLSKDVATTVELDNESTLNQDRMQLLKPLVAQWLLADAII